jgi:target of EGR1 protein 1
LQGEKSVRNLFCSIVAAKKPLILHNGILDLVFLYGNLYAPLPATMSTFISDLAEMFPSGIYDTKTFAEYKLRLEASYLTYVFRKLQRQNHDKERKRKTHVVLDFVGDFLKDDKLTKDLLYRDCSIRDPPAFNVTSERPVCENFASHGWCTSAHNCPFSHDIDDILDLESNRQGISRRSKKTKRRLKSIAFDSRPTPENDEIANDDAVITLSKDDSHLDTTSNGPSTRGANRTESTSSEAIIHNTHGHRAGYDAFMTGFTLACLMAQQQQQTQQLQQQQQQQTPLPPRDFFAGLSDFRNKLFLSRKDFQLTISKSSYGKVSREHQKKMEKLKLNSLL